MIWSTLVDTKRVTNGKIAIPLFQSKIPAEKYLRDPENGMVDRTTFLHVALYPSVFQRMPYAPIFVVSSLLFSSIDRISWTLTDIRLSGPFRKQLKSI